MAGSPSMATELYSFRDVDGGCRDIDRQSLRRLGLRKVRTEIMDTAENLLSKLIFHCVKRVESRIEVDPVRPRRSTIGKKIEWLR